MATIMGKNVFRLIFILLALALQLHARRFEDVSSAPLSCLNTAAWEMLLENAGVSAMHMALMPDDNVVIFDYTYSSHPSNISLPTNTKCIPRTDFFDPKNTVKLDCWAHSVEIDLSTRRVRPLTLLTDTWCSGAGLDRNGVLVQHGGWRDGGRVVRRLGSCLTCDWEEKASALVDNRWYATSQTLPDGRIIVIGGTDVFTYEFIPTERRSYYMPFLSDTLDRIHPSEKNNLYPFVHLLPDGNLFIFANKKSILFDYQRNAVIRTFPDMPPSGISRNYPSSGSSVMLGLDDRKPTMVIEILVCGGSPSRAFSTAEGVDPSFLRADDTCGRITVTENSPVWTLEKMPIARVMGNLVLLPTEEVLIINGASAGSAGWNRARDPVLYPVIYRPYRALSERFQVQSPSCRPRMYHSSCHLLRDARILVGGSNAHQYYEFGLSDSSSPFPTDLSLEIFSPPYLRATSARPAIVSLSRLSVGYDSAFLLRFGDLVEGDVAALEVSVVAPTLTTHAFSMHQRLVRLRVTGRFASDRSLLVTSPSNSSLAPPGYYMLFLVLRGVPSVGSWLRFS